MRPSKASRAVTRRGDDPLIVDTHGSAVANSATRDFAARQLEIFTLRCLVFADRVAARQIAFLDATDLLYDAAVWSGLVDAVGDDLVQACMAECFADARAP
jgi:hypothetical protein